MRTFTSPDGGEVGFEVDGEADIAQYFRFIGSQERSIVERVEMPDPDRPGWRTVDFIPHTVWVVPARVAPLIETQYIEWSLASRAVPTPPPIVDAPDPAREGVRQICCLYRDRPSKGRPHMNGEPIIDERGGVIAPVDEIIHNSISVSGSSANHYRGELIFVVHAPHVRLSWADATIVTLTSDGWARFGRQWRHSSIPTWLRTSPFTRGARL